MDIGVYNPRNFPFLDPPQISIPCVLPRNLHNSLRLRVPCGASALRRGTGVGAASVTNAVIAKAISFGTSIPIWSSHYLLEFQTPVPPSLPPSLMLICQSAKFASPPLCFCSVRSAAEVGLMMRPPGTYVKELRRRGGGSSTLRSSKK